MGTLSVKLKTGYKESGDRARLVHYVHSKNGKEIRFHGGRGVPRDIDKALACMIRIQEKYKKADGRRLYHLMVGFPKDIRDVFLVQKVAEAIADYFFEEFQLLYGIHEDTKKLHIHFIINSVSYSTRNKMHFENGELEDMKLTVLHVVNNVLNTNGYESLSIKRKRRAEKKVDV